jgi:hypothetical protein
MELWFIDPKQSRFAVAVSGEQLQARQLDEFPATGALARLVVLGLYPTTDPRIRAGLLEAWQDLHYSEGVRAYSRSDISDGGTPGYLLYAAAEAGMGFTDELAKRVTDNFCSATGNLWELQSATDPAWGTEKRRLWDSAVLLMALLHESKLPSKTATSSAYQTGAALSRLLDPASQMVLVENNSTPPARELATQLARYYGAPVSVTQWAGKFPGKDNYIFISPTAPPSGGAGKRTRTFAGDNYQGASFDAGGGQTQTIIWVKNRGKVFSDLRGLEYDLFRAALPRRKPAPYPKSDLEVARQIAEKPRDSFAVTMTCDRPITLVCGDKTVVGKQMEFALRPNPEGLEAAEKGDLQVSASGENEKIVALTVRAGDARPSRYPPSTRASRQNDSGPDLSGAKARVEVLLPPGWWLLEASGLQTTWNRLVDPIDEIHRPDGSRIFIFRVTFPHQEAKSFTLRLARPAIVTPSPPAPAPLPR